MVVSSRSERCEVGVIGAVPSVPTRLTHPDADVEIRPAGSGRSEVEIFPRRPIYISRRSVLTTYPVDLIGHILKIKGPDYLCDEIARDEDPQYVQRWLRDDLLGFLDEALFRGARVMDFGCGSGASTMILARMFPETEIIGIELDPALLTIARERLEHYRYPNVRFLQSPSGTQLPGDCGSFDVIVLSAVVEHLLPRERKTILPLLWHAVRAGGVLCVNQTPHRYFPIEAHTTGLPLLNYLPARLALLAARRFSERIDKTESWETLLRRGIRGSTEREIRRNLGPDAVELRPLTGDRVDLWRSQLSPRHPAIKNVAALGMKVVSHCMGTVVSPNISVVFRKAQAESSRLL